MPWHTDQTWFLKNFWRSNFRCGDYLQPSVISQTTKSLCTSRRNCTHMSSMSSYLICRPHFLSEKPVFFCFSPFLVLLKLIYRFETHYTYEKLQKDSKWHFFFLFLLCKWRLCPFFPRRNCKLWLYFLACGVNFTTGPSLGQQHATRAKQAQEICPPRRRLTMLRPGNSPLHLSCEGTYTYHIFSCHV